MSMNIVCQSQLPFAIVIAADRERTVLSTSWRSPRGLHIISMELPTGQVLDDDEPDVLENALRDFLLLVELEVRELIGQRREEEN